MRRRVLGIALAALALAPATADARERWDTRLLARVPEPGFPAHAYVHPNGRIYEGTYVNSNSSAPSRILEYAGDGTLLRSWTMTGQELNGEQGVQVATSDALGRLVLLDHSPPRALLLDSADGALRTYATFPEGAIPNYAAWGPGGELYVTDYAKNVVWRLPPGGGQPQLWLQDARLNTVEFGTTGIALAADRHTLLIGQQTSPAGGNPTAGAVFSVAIGSDGKPARLTRIWQSGAMDLPDGFAIARSGRIYVAALGPNQIIVLGPDGREQERFPQLPLQGDNGSGVPFDALSSLAFRGTSLIAASQSNPQANPEHWAIHDVEVGEPGLPELIPVNAGGSHTISLRVSPQRVPAGRRVRLRFLASVGDTAVAGALIRVAGRRVRTDDGGRAGLTIRFRRAGARGVIADATGLTAGRATIRVRAA
jgi:hypothetical protein